MMEQQQGVNPERSRRLPFRSLFEDSTVMSSNFEQRSNTDMPIVEQHQTNSSAASSHSRDNAARSEEDKK